MKKLKDWWKVHWFSATVVLIALLLSGLSIYFAFDLAKKTKDISEKRGIYQLAITAIAASVGIGTIINSSRTATISAESMKLTKDKDLREQSSHLVPISPSGEFIFSMPNHKINQKIYNFFDTSVGRHQIISNAEKVIETRYKYAENGEINIKLMNVGKGSCINLEYLFSVDNLKDFDNYYYFCTSSLEHPSSNRGLYYTLQTIYHKRDKMDALEILIDDHAIQESLEAVGMITEDAKEFSEYATVIEQPNNTILVDFMKPQSETTFPIPNSFILLCKQYFVATNNIFNASYNENQEKLDLVSEPVVPIGRVSLSYHDESLIRLGELSSDKKTTFEYTITPKIRSSINSLLAIPFYLEIKPLEPKTKKKRAYI